MWPPADAQQRKPHDMTSASKVLAVLTTLFSLAFMGFALASSVGGPNWQRSADEIDGWSFQQSDGENPTWSATQTVSGESAGSSSPVLPEVIVSVRNRIKSEQQDELDEINAEISQLEQQIAETIRTKQISREALVRREEELVAEIDRITEEIENQSRQANAVAEQSREVREEATRRREDVARLGNSLALVEADLFRTRQQRVSLEDRLKRLQGQVGRLERRNSQLSRQQPASQQQ